DLGLCKPVKYLQSSENNGIYGVLPFVTPEILRGQPYTLASDIYSFSMIMWEFTSGIIPFNNEAYDLQLSLNIYKGKRPEIIKDTSQCYVNLMKSCWNINPSKRPIALDIKNIIKSWTLFSSNKCPLKGDLMTLRNSNFS
ncbi:10763_t:CDS:2, partial [Funneliformis geosporum]